MPRSRALVALIALLTAALVGCSDDTPAEQLPAGATLVSEAATATDALTSAHLKIDSEGEVGSLPMRRADVDLLRSGDAKGTIQLGQFGTLLEYEFVILGDSIYLKGVTGGWQKLPAAQAATIYDASAILDPDRGVAKLLRTAKEPSTEAKETVDGKDAYRVAVKLDSGAVSALVPGLDGEVTGKLWIDGQAKHLLKAVLTVPGTTADKPGTVTINVTAIDVPVTIGAP
jgi:lipoprotein LprG